MREIVVRSMFYCTLLLWCLYPFFMILTEEVFPFLLVTLRREPS